MLGINTMFTWLPLPQLPHPPQEIIDRALSIGHNPDVYKMDNSALNTKDKDYKNRIITKTDGTKTKTRIQFGVNLGLDWEEWVKENIIENFVNTGLRISAYTEYTTTHGAHSDGWFNGKPSAKLYYLLETGGDNVITSFYKEQGQPLERYGDPANMCSCLDYSKLDLLSQTVFPKHQWVLLNTDILHGVENIEGDRINLAILINKDQLKLTLIN